MTEEVEEKAKTNLVMRIDSHTRERLDRAIAKLPDSQGMQAAILRSGLKLYLAASEGDIEQVEGFLKRITGNPDLRLEGMIPHV